MPKGFYDERYRRVIDRLVALRKQLDLSQSDVASRLGTHQQFVSRYETGERRIDAIELLDICTALEADGIKVLQSVID